MMGEDCSEESLMTSCSWPAAAGLSAAAATVTLQDCLLLFLLSRRLSEMGPGLLVEGQLTEQLAQDTVLADDETCGALWMERAGCRGRVSTDEWARKEKLEIPANPRMHTSGHHRRDEGPWATCSVVGERHFAACNNGWSWTTRRGKPRICTILTAF
eukprot:1149345-Pelagomonas_calceolata.AAC.10